MPASQRSSRAAEAHRRAGLAAVTGAHYEGGHWLGSFAVYLVSERGIQRQSRGRVSPEPADASSTPAKE